MAKNKRQAATRSESAQPAWPLDYFGDAYLEIYSRFLYDREEIRDEVDFIVRTLDLKPDDRILDLACGFGKHIPFFLGKKLRCHGLDISLPYLLHAGGMIPGKKAKKTALVRGDMRSLPFSSERFKAVVCLFNSFGYFKKTKPDPHLKVLREAARILHPGGRFLLEVPNKKPVVAMVRNNPQTLQCGSDFMIHELWDYDPETSMLHNRTSFVAGKSQSRAGYRLKLFTRGELKNLFQRAGLLEKAVFGDYTGSDYSPFASPHLIMIGKREG